MTPTAKRRTRLSPSAREHAGRASAAVSRGANRGVGRLRKLSRRSLQRVAVVIVAVLGVALVVTGCPAKGVPALPEVPDVEVRPTTTTLLDFSSMSLTAAQGTTTTLAPNLDGGSATLRGTVLAGGSPIPGATIEIVRFVGADNRTASKTVTAGVDGTWTAANVEGGRYRVRAYRAPDLTADQGQVFFLKAGENRTVDISLAAFGGGISVTAAIAPSPPILGQTANLAVSITSQVVDGSGVARYSGQSDVPLTLVTAGGRAIVSANPVVTDRSGRATWTLRCDALTAQELSVILPDGTSRSTSVAGCSLPPTTTTLLQDPAALLPPPA